MLLESPIIRKIKIRSLIECALFIDVKMATIKKMSCKCWHED